MSDYLNVDYFVAPNSSWIKGVAYDEEEKVTYVRTMNDNVYGYSDTEYSDFAGLAHAESVGHEYQNFADDFGPSAHFGEIDMYLRVAPEPDPIAVALTEWENDLLAQNEAEKSVASENVVNTDWVEANLRREALTLAVEVHKGTAQDDSVVLDTAEAFKEYLNA